MCVDRDGSLAPAIRHRATQHMLTMAQKTLYKAIRRISHQFNYWMTPNESFLNMSEIPRLLNSKHTSYDLMQKIWDFCDSVSVLFRTLPGFKLVSAALVSVVSLLKL